MSGPDACTYRQRAAAPQSACLKNTATCSLTFGSVNNVTSQTISACSATGILRNGAAVDGKVNFFR